jgi:hypothetical protein
VLKTLPGVDRPAIISAIPSLGGHTIMLDLGANSVCTARQLCEFAVMGDIVACDLHGIERPRVGLLNIGTEDIKGNDTLQAGAPVAARQRAELRRLRRGHRHHVRHRRRGGHRRLHRQRRAEDDRGHGKDARAGDARGDPAQHPQPRRWR